MIQPARSLKITPTHLERKAIIYIRQSSPKQVRLNTESQRNQRALVERAQSLGWSQARIVVLDADLGQSATSKEGRDDFTQLAADVALGHVGIIFGWEVSRLARNNADWYQLLDLAAVVGALIADIEGVYDPRSYNDRLLLGLKGTMSEAELHMMRQRLSAGRLSKVARGEYMQHLPTGLVRTAEGRVEKDPDEQIRRCIALVFSTFAELGSGLKTLHFRKRAPYLVASPPNQRPAQRGVALERANRIDDHRDLAQSGLCRSLCLWAASHRSDAAQTRTTWLRSGAQADGGVGDASTGRVSGLH
jgi:DNA invertase Pin-like site-specific DNA recombinase